MEALFGFSRYKVGQMVELNRWKDLYTHVSKAQKKVRLSPTSIDSLTSLLTGWLS